MNFLPKIINYGQLNIFTFKEGEKSDCRSNNQNVLKSQDEYSFEYITRKIKTNVYTLLIKKK